MSEKKSFLPMLAKVNNAYLPLIERQLTNHGIKLDEYSKTCIINAISAINGVLDAAGVSWGDPTLDQSNITSILLQIATLKLNAAASPREVYFQLRKEKRTVNGRDVWVKKLEMNIEGDGNDAILARFGRGVKEVCQFWLVREGDEFEYPSFDGLKMTPPKWKPKGYGKVVRVVYPIIKKDGRVEFYIGEREEVVKNLIAHVNNNLLNETFGIAKDRWTATAEQKEQINAKKKAIIDKIKQLGLDKALDDPEIQQYISPAWREEHSRESMIIRKMRNNVVKRIPKDFGSPFISLMYEEATDDESIQREIQENANIEFIDIEPEDVQEVDMKEIEPPEESNQETEQSQEAQHEEKQDEKPAEQPEKQKSTKRSRAKKQDTKQIEISIDEGVPY